MILDNAYKILTMWKDALILTCVACLKAAPIFQSQALECES
jgi:hypothetical protein